MNNIKCIVVGYGSAGQRHTRNAQTLGCEVSLVTSQKIANFKCYQDLSSAITQEKPQFVIIASPTYRHMEELRHCILNKIPCLIEKPLATGYLELGQIMDMDCNPETDYRVAYCLRYHPMVQKFRSEIYSLGRLHSASMTFGQYLPWWRPGADYRNCYSASDKEGGGILLDASHELDLLTYFFGPVKRLVAISKKISSLEIESDDLCMAIFEMNSGQNVQINMDYMNQIQERRIVVNGDNGTIHMDLNNMKYQSRVNNLLRDEAFEVERNNLFMQELDDFINHRDRCLLPDLRESEMTLRIIDAVRLSSEKEEWINL